MLVWQTHTALFDIRAVPQDFLEGIVQCSLDTGALVLGKHFEDIGADCFLHFGEV